MARGINKVILVGTLGRDPEVRFMPSGGAVANLNLATNESWKDKQSGQMQERTEWHRIVMFNRLAEIAGEYLKKGAQIYIEGKLQTREWEKDGVKRYTTEIVANEMQMLGGRSSGGGGGDYGSSMGGGASGGGQQSRPAPQQQKPQQGESFEAMDDFDDDIPF